MRCRIRLGFWMILLIIILIPGLPLRAETGFEDPVGKAGTIPEDNIQDTSPAPTLAVYYHETAGKNLPASPDNMGTEIFSISPPEVNRDSEIYIREDTQVILKIHTEDFDSHRVRVAVYEDDYQSRTRKDVTSEYYDDKKWTRTGNESFYLPILFRREGHFQLEIAYRSLDQQLLEPALEEQGGCFYNGTYIGPHLTVDKKDPVIAGVTTGMKPAAMVGEIPCFESCPEYELVVEEENFHPGYFRWRKDEDRITMSEWSVFYEGGIRKNKASFCPKEEGFYSLPYEIRDGSGRKCVGKIIFQVDTSPPEIKISPDPGSPYFRYPYEDISLVSGNPMIFSFEASDLVSGIHSIHYHFRTPEGEVDDVVREVDGQENHYKIKVTLPREDFHGWITATCTDNMGRTGKTITSPVFLWESRNMFNAGKHFKISYSQAEYTDEKNRIKYYKEAALIRADGGNDYAGVRESYLKAVFGKEKQVENKDYHSGKQITPAYHQEMTLAPEDYEESCKDKPVKVLGGFTDNAGYKTGKKQGRYGIVIDHLPPVISVDYHDGKEGNPHQGETYYDCPRSAIVTVTDRNFNPSSCSWHISGKESGYTLGSWHGEGIKHWCKIDFRKDGTYRVGLTAGDYSGNTASYQSGEAFTIDQTPPELFLWMDKSKACHKKYYSETEMVYIFVKEENGSKKRIHLFTGKGPERKISAVLSSADSYMRKMMKQGWKIYSYAAKKEGIYRLSCYCEDMAGNSSGNKSLPLFVVDKTPPEIDQENFREGITYTGEAAPRISVRDTNLDEGSCRLEVFYTDGTRAINLENQMIASGKEKGEKTFYWRDIPLEKKYDNKYIFRISARDLAGNKVSLREMTFYVDRYGARYQLPEETSDYLQRYYNNREQDVSVTAFSLHPLKTDIMITYNNEDFHTLGKEDYEEEAEILKDKEKKGAERILPAIHKGWYQTTYTIDKEVFREEGSYNIALRSREIDYNTVGTTQENSENAASGDNNVLTESETILWTDPIEFVIDKTPPSIMIGGLDQETYVADRKKYTVTALDNMRLKKVKLSVRKEKEAKGQTVLLTEEDFKENHSFTSELAAYEGYQILAYDAWDYAGNKVSNKDRSEEKKVLVTGSRLFHFYYRHRKGLALGMLILSVGVIFGIFLTRGFFSDIFLNISKKERQDGFSGRSDDKDEKTPSLWGK